MLACLWTGIWGHLLGATSGHQDDSGVCWPGVHLRICGRDAAQVGCLWIQDILHQCLVLAGLPHRRRKIMINIVEHWWHIIFCGFDTQSSGGHLRYHVTICVCLTGVSSVFDSKHPGILRAGSHQVFEDTESSQALEGPVPLWGHEGETQVDTRWIQGLVSWDFRSWPSCKKSPYYLAKKSF